MLTGSRALTRSQAGDAEPLSAWLLRSARSLQTAGVSLRGRVILVVVGVVTLVAGISIDSEWLVWLGSGLILSAFLILLLRLPNLRAIAWQPWWLAVAVVLLGVVTRSRPLMVIGWVVVVVLAIERLLLDRADRRGDTPERSSSDT